MSHDMEAAGAASLGGLVSGEHHAVGPPGEPCRNCGTPVGERYCTRCGQLASNFHRPFLGLMTSSMADTFSLDSRLLRTLPVLLFRPGRVTRNYLDGQRARYVPPFRMFLLSSVLFFLTVFGLGDRLGWYQDWSLNLDNDGAAIVSEEDRSAALERLRAELAEPDLPDARREEVERSIRIIEAGTFSAEGVIHDGKVDRQAVNDLLDQQTGMSPQEVATVRAAVDRAADVFENQDVFAARFREWAPRFSLMFMPLLGLMLTGVYFWQRRIYVYDHVITALHFQTFVYGLLTLSLLSAAFLHVPVVVLSIFGTGWVVFYLYRQLRVVYGTGRLMAALRTFILLILGITVLGMLGVGLVVLSFLQT